MIAGAFRTREVFIALASAIAAQWILYRLFSSPSPSTVRAEISDDRSRPIAVAITPVSAIPSAEHPRTPLPKAWQRHSASAVPSHQSPKLAASNLGTVTAPDAAAPRAVPDAGALAGTTELRSPSPVEPARPAATSDNPASPSTQGTAAATGLADDVGIGEPGAESDPLKARAIRLYRAELASWFMARFDIRGKIPFQTLKGLRAAATVSVTPDHTVAGYELGKNSGDPVFDAQVRTTLAAIEASGATLPPPPPAYSDLLGSKLSVSFQCTVRSACE